MEPRIQYAQTKDGVSIAYWTYGEGPALGQMPSSVFSPSTRAWEFAEGRRWFEGLANGRMLVRFDHRGFGYSKGSAPNFSIDGQLEDLLAVVDRLGLERFALFGYLFSGPPAISYAARHPDRVSHLLLWCTSAQTPDLWPAAREQALEGLREADFELYTETLALATFGWSAADQARQYAERLREELMPLHHEESPHQFVAAAHEHGEGAVDYLLTASFSSLEKVVPVPAGKELLDQKIVELLMTFALIDASTGEIEWQNSVSSAAAFTTRSFQN